MNFLYPAFLYFLALTAIPVIIHLFNFRKHKTIYFSNIRFLSQLSIQTKSQNKLKHLLVLLARIFAVTCLVLAFSQPFIPAINNISKGEKEIIAIYLDNSFSMDAAGVKGSLFEEAKSKAVEIAGIYPASTGFLFLTNDFEPRHQRSVNKEQITEYIAELQVSPRTAKFTDVADRARQLALYSSGNKPAITLYVISDMQKSNFNISETETDSLTRLMLFPVIPLSENKNLTIDSCWFETPNHSSGANEKLFVRIVNYSGDSYSNIPVRLLINDSVKTVSGFNIEGNSTQTVVLNYSNLSTGASRGRAEISDYPVTFDNTYYFNYDITEKIKILSVNGKNAFKNFTKLFKTDSVFLLKEVNEANITFSELGEYNLLILNHPEQISTGLQQEIAGFTAKGGSVVVIPDSKPDIGSYNNLLNICGLSMGNADTANTYIHVINEKAPFFKEVFVAIGENPNLPFIKHLFSVKHSGNNRADELFLTRGNSPAMFFSEAGRGKIYFFAFPFGEKFTDFTVHPVFVPVFYRICLESIIYHDLCYFISPGLTMTVPEHAGFSDSPVKLIHTGNNIEFIPKQERAKSGIVLYPGNELSQDGTYAATVNNNILSYFSFNYSRDESRPVYHKPEEAMEILKNKKNNVSLFNISDTGILQSKLIGSEKGRPLWYFFLIAALVFIGVEILLIRFT